LGKNFENKASIGYIVDLLALPDRMDVTDALLMEGIKHFDEESTNLIQALVVRNHPYENLYRKRGFLDSRIKVLVSHRSTDKKIKIVDLESPRKIHIQYGDTDWI
jgi:hypothetical protein